MKHPKDRVMKGMTLQSGSDPTPKSNKNRMEYWQAQDAIAELEKKRQTRMKMKTKKQYI